jgi:tRNA(adenine34) deaminase
MVAAPKKAASEHAAKKAPAMKKWVTRANTESTHPPPGLFRKSAAAIARTLASRKVSPKGLTSGLRMLTFYINRAGNKLTAHRRSELEKARRLMSARIVKARPLRRAA